MSKFEKLVHVVGFIVRKMLYAYFISRRNRRLSHFVGAFNLSPSLSAFVVYLRIKWKQLFSGCHPAFGFHMTCIIINCISV